MGLENGYEYVYMPTNPMAKQNGCVYLHRLIMSNIIGRPLLNEEHVHHIDGNKLNNCPDNLMIVTRSEHATIEHALRGEVKKEYFCKECNKPLLFKTKNNLCLECYRKHSRKFNPTKEELECLVWSMPTTRLAQIFGVSDSAIGKRCRLFGISKPPPGYWRKLETGKI